MEPTKDKKLKRGRIKNILIDIVCFLIYNVLALLYTYPIIFNFRDKIIGHRDAWWNVWVMWWTKQAIGSPEHHLWYSDYLFYPQGFYLSRGYDNIINVLLSIPLQEVFSLPVIYNILVIANFGLAAFTAYLFVKHLYGNRTVSFLAGIIFGFSTYMLMRGTGHLNLLTIGFVPLFILYFIKLHHKGNQRYVILTAICLLLVALSSWQYLIFSTYFIILYLLYYLLFGRKKIIKTGFLIRVLISLCLAAILILPFAYPMLQEYFGGEIVKYKDIDVIQYSSDLYSYFIPSLLQLPTETNRFITTEVFDSLSEIEKISFLGYLEVIVVLVIIPILLIRNRLKKIRLWCWLFAGFFVLSLGPTLQVFGKIEIFPKFFIGLPYFIFQYIPLLSFIRTPNRISIMAMFCLAVIVCYLLNRYIVRNNKLVPRTKKILLTLIIILFIVERFIFNYPTTDTAVPSFYHQIAEENEDYALLEVPFNELMTPTVDYWQITHQKKLVGGIFSYAAFDEEVLKFYADNPFMTDFLCGVDQDISQLDNRDYSSIINTLQNNKIKYVVVHKDTLEVPFCQQQKEYIYLFTANLGNIYYEDQQLIVYEVY